VNSLLIQHEFSVITLCKRGCCRRYTGTNPEYFDPHDTIHDISAGGKGWRSYLADGNK
jgi:hypothetical protein